MNKGYKNIEHLNFISEKLFKSIAKKNGFFDTRFITNWKHIAGEELYKKCTPVKLVYNPLTKKAVLFLYTEDLSLKSMFTHYKEYLLQKISLYFGVNFIQDIKITHY